MTEWEKSERKFEHYIILAIIAGCIGLVDLGIVLARMVG